MKKFLAVTLAVAMAATVLTGCGESKKESNGGSKAEVNTEVKGTVSVGINSYRSSDFDAICEAFEKQYPNVEIEAVYFESTTDDAVEYLTCVVCRRWRVHVILFPSVVTFAADP